MAHVNQWLMTNPWLTTNPTHGPLWCNIRLTFYTAGLTQSALHHDQTLTRNAMWSLCASSHSGFLSLKPRGLFTTPVKNLGNGCVVGASNVTVIFITCCGRPWLTTVYWYGVWLISLWYQYCTYSFPSHYLLWSQYKLTYGYLSFINQWSATEILELPSRPAGCRGISPFNLKVVHRASPKVAIPALEISKIKHN